MALAVLRANLSLAFTSPYVGPNGLNLLNYDVGQQVNVSWRTPFERTTLEVWQGPQENGSYVRQLLAPNFTQEMTYLMWTAAPVQNANLSSGFYFRLQKGDAPNDCDLCVAESTNFRVRDPRPQSSSSSTSLASSTTLSTSTSTVATPAAETTSAAPAPVSHGISEGARLGIGLGIGLGVGALLILLGLLIFFLNRRKKRQQQARELDQRQQEAVRTSMASAGADSWMTKASKTMSFHSRFEFETPDGSIKEGSEALFARTERPGWLNRAPSKPKGAFFRS